MNFLDKTFITAVVVGALLSQSAFALDLQSARKSGAVKETSAGYIEAVKSSADVDSLVSEVNAKRKAEYERIAKEKGQPVDAVAKVAAQELMKKN
jgi:uncharacterized protein YdbL (DUF1318 family)